MSCRLGDSVQLGGCTLVRKAPAGLRLVQGLYDHHGELDTNIARSHC